MRTRTRKSGFTLVELMIVAAIIAILAAILIPLLSSNKDSAIASEAANVCGAIATEMKTYYARTGTFPDEADLAAGVIDDEINKGRYFTWNDVSIGGDGTTTWSVTVSGTGTSGSAGGNGFSTGASENLSLGNTANAAVGPIYAGSMVTAGWVAN